MTILLFIYLLCLACWLGAIVFFSFIAAPAVFAQLPMTQAGKVISTIFPRYYAVGCLTGPIALLIALYMLTALRGVKAWLGVTALALAIAVGCTFYAALVVRPKVDALRTVAEQQNPDPARKAEFERLHRLAVMLNGAVLLLDLIAFVGTAGALSPRV